MVAYHILYGFYFLQANTNLYSQSGFTVTEVTQVASSRSLSVGANIGIVLAAACGTLLLVVVTIITAACCFKR